MIDTLKTVDEDRKCFRLVGGVLCERTVKDVLPQLNEAKDQLDKIIASKHELLTQKGIEINKFREKHNIKIKGQGDAPEVEAAAAADSDEKRNHVLVSD